MKKANRARKLAERRLGFGHAGALNLDEQLDLAKGYIDLTSHAGLIITGLMEIAEQAMPDSFYASDRRVQAARKFMGYKRLDLDE